MSSLEKRSRFLKFKDCKVRYEVMANRKKLMEKRQLKELHFEESLSLKDSMCTENHNIFYKPC